MRGVQYVGKEQLGPFHDNHDLIHLCGEVVRNPSDCTRALQMFIFKKKHYGHQNENAIFLQPYLDCLGALVYDFHGNSAASFVNYKSKSDFHKSLPDIQDNQAIFNQSGVLQLKVGRILKPGAYLYAEYGWSMAQWKTAYEGMRFVIFLRVFCILLYSTLILKSLSLSLSLSVSLPHTHTHTHTYTRTHTHTHTHKHITHTHTHTHIHTHIYTHTHTYKHFVATTLSQRATSSC